MPLEDGSITEKKDLPYFKDEVARGIKIPGQNVTYLDWTHFRTDWFGQSRYEIEYDRAATLFAEHREREGYEQGFKDATPR